MPIEYSSDRHWMIECDTETKWRITTIARAYGASKLRLAGILLRMAAEAFWDAMTMSTPEQLAKNPVWTDALVAAKARKRGPKPEEGKEGEGDVPSAE